ncbi:hypothetical protein COCMIDRAFT_26327 [Bipolaris oryzae ATCC 44560]|uniref:Uncharacterized protein n=1 Tax=Bipolaris oryzae ATCC 44560 TaxID=930090 RepID=W6Z153_COCMI|nr:uncharacterized protein COCMIDRAFT_26327 [Bipolaris oryzae ATCC 44560]EUC45497.1 hypothetical protein COCMIDRAFT_26327 [Bipolaris oryzae ATCC 44560]
MPTYTKHHWYYSRRNVNVFLVACKSLRKTVGVVFDEVILRQGQAPLLRQKRERVKQDADSDSHEQQNLHRAPGQRLLHSRPTGSRVSLPFPNTSISPDAPPGLAPTIGSSQSQGPIYYTPLLGRGYKHAASTTLLQTPRLGVLRRLIRDPSTTMVQSSGGDLKAACLPL